MTSQTDARGCVTNLRYDALGRPLTVTAPDGTQTEYEYDILTPMDLTVSV